MNADILRLADSSVSPWPMGSLTLLFVGLSVVIIVIAVSSAVQARIQRSRRRERETTVDPPAEDSE